MNKALLAGMATLILFATAPAVVFADWHPGMEEAWVSGTDWRPDIRDRIHSIQNRIHQGIHNGELTDAEAGDLSRELDDIRIELDGMTADHYLSGSERERVVQRLNILSKRVWRLKHNDVVR